MTKLISSDDRGSLKAFVKDKIFDKTKGKHVFTNSLCYTDNLQLKINKSIRQKLFRFFKEPFNQDDAEWVNDAMSKNDTMCLFTFTKDYFDNTTKRIKENISSAILFSVINNEAIVFDYIVTDTKLQRCGYATFLMYLAQKFAVKKIRKHHANLQEQNPFIYLWCQQEKFLFMK